MTAFLFYIGGALLILAPAAFIADNFIFWFLED
jgi:hypothetical protein